MNKSTFADLVNYIKNRPEEAKKLRDALALGADKAECNLWLSAASAGELIGKSGKWVREHTHLFPSAFQSGIKGTWFVKKGELLRNYEMYIKTK